MSIPQAELYANRMCQNITVPSHTLIRVPTPAQLSVHEHELSHKHFLENHLILLMSLSPLWFIARGEELPCRQTRSCHAVCLRYGCLVALFIRLMNSPPPRYCLLHG